MKFAPRLLLLPLLLLVSCAKRPATNPKGPAVLPKITVQLDWIAEPEHGAFYMAEAKGYFKAEGLDVTLLQGGPNTYVLARVATGQVQIGQSDSTTALLAIHSGAPLLNIGAIFQHDPSALMMQEACTVHTWTDLAGRTIMARPEWAFLPYLRKKYGIQFQVIPHNFDLGRLAADPQFIEQGYAIAEPYHLEKQGIKLRLLLVRDTGFDPYATIITNRQFAREHGAELRAFLRALYRGYHDYIEGDPTPAHAIMLKINAKATADYLDWSRQQIIKNHLAHDAGGDYLHISLDRYREQIAQLEDLNILPKGALHAEQVADPSFLPH